MTAARRRSALLAIAACGGSSAPPLGERVGPLVGAALTAADHERGPWRCAAPDGPSLADEQLTVGGHAWKLGSHAVQRVDASPDVVIGVVADAAGAAPATIAALGRLRAKLEAARPTIVLTLGGMGANERELETTLAVLADKASWPVVALPGDLEPVTAHDEAVATLRKRGVPVIDGRLAHRIELGGATIATLPGAGAATRLPAGADGCSYRPQDVTAATTDLRDAKGIRILASFEAPRPAGEIPTDDQSFDIAVSAPVAPGASKARNGTRDGNRVALTPGTSDATVRLPRITSTAGLIVIHDGGWTWKPLADGN